MTQSVRYAVLAIHIALLSSSALGKWGFQSSFRARPRSPSQKLLPRHSFDFVVTHRTHPKEHFSRKFQPFPADHDETCRGPDPKRDPLPQHLVTTTHTGRGYNPDPAFYICNRHLMSAMGDVSPYSIASFFPKQEWSFSRGGTLEFEVSNNAKRRRHWFEILITPRALLSVAAGPDWAPIEEHYPTERLVFRFLHGHREMQAGTRALDPRGRFGDMSDSSDGRFPWYIVYPKDWTMDDRRARLAHKISISRNRRHITWSIRTYAGVWDSLVMPLRTRIPFTQGIVQFKTHSYTPTKDGNYDDYTDHWSNIRWTGPRVGRYRNYESKNVIYMQRNGDSFVGNTKTNRIFVRRLGKNPIVFGQVHQPVKGEVLLSINRGAFFEVKPYRYTDSCAAYGWMSFQFAVDPNVLKRGMNSFQWKIGRRKCNAGGHWIGYSIKSLEIQFDI